VSGVDYPAPIVNTPTPCPGCTCCDAAICPTKCSKLCPHKNEAPKCGICGFVDTTWLRLQKHQLDSHVATSSGISVSRDHYYPPPVPKKGLWARFLDRLRGRSP
jgi:hypothetical protein